MADIISNEANVWNPRTVLSISADTKAVEQRLIAVEGQTLFTITDFAYVVGTGALEIHKNGLLLPKNSAWFEQGTQTFALTISTTAGDEIIATAHVGITGTVPIALTSLEPVVHASVLAMTTNDGLVEGQLVHTLGFTLAGDGGGAEYRVITGTGTANGFNIIASTVLSLSFVLISDSVINPQQLGAKGDGVTDDILAMQASFDLADLEGLPIHWKVNYKLNESINGKGVDILATGNPTIDFKSATTLSIRSACISNLGTLTNLGAPSGDIDKGDATFTLASPPSGLLLGDALFIVSTEQYSNERAEYTRGEAITINTITGAVVDTNDTARDDYTAANTTVFKLNPVSFKYGKFKLLAPDFAGSYGIRTKNGRDISFDCTIIGGGIGATEFEQCVNVYGAEARIIQARDDTGNTAGLEYGLIITSCQKIAFDKSLLIGGRHGITTGSIVNDFPTDTIAIVCRDILPNSCFIGNDPLFTGHAVGGATIQSCDMHGNTEGMIVSDCIIQNGGIIAGNQNKYLGNHFIGFNDNSNNIIRGSGLTGFDHEIANNTSDWGEVAVPVSSNQPGIFALFSDTGSGAVDSRNSLRFGGTFHIHHNSFILHDSSLVANTIPHEFQIRLDNTFTEECHILFEDNTTQMPNNGALKTIGIRLNALSNNLVNAPRTLNSFIERDNHWINCGAMRSITETITTQYAADTIICTGSIIEANDQAEQAYLLRGVKDYAEVTPKKLDGLKQTPVLVTNAQLTIQTAATATQVVKINDLKITNSINSGGTAPDRTMYLVVGARTLIAENNTNFDPTVDSGTHDGGNDVALLTDSTQAWTVNEFVGLRIDNTTDGSFATITANTATTVTATLAGGTDDDWDTNDAYSIGTAKPSNLASLADLDPWPDSQVWRSNNIDTGGILNFVLNANYKTEVTDHLGDSYPNWDPATKVGALTIVYGVNYAVSTAGGAFAVAFPTANLPSNAEVSFLDVAASFGANTLTLTYNGAQTFMGAAADHLLTANNVHTKWRLFANDWRIIS